MASSSSCSTRDGRSFARIPWDRLRAFIDEHEAFERASGGETRLSDKQLEAISILVPVAPAVPAAGATHHDLERLYRHLQATKSLDGGIEWQHHDVDVPVNGHLVKKWATLCQLGATWGTFPRSGYGLLDDGSPPVFDTKQAGKQFAAQQALRYLVPSQQGKIAAAALPSSSASILKAKQASADFQPAPRAGQPAPVIQPIPIVHPAPVIHPAPAQTAPIIQPPVIHPAPAVENEPSTKSARPPNESPESTPSPFKKQRPNASTNDAVHKPRGQFAPDLEDIAGLSLQAISHEIAELCTALQMNHPAYQMEEDPDSSGCFKGHAVFPPNETWESPEPIEFAVSAAPDMAQLQHRIAQRVLGWLRSERRYRSLLLSTTLMEGDSKR